MTISTFRYQPIYLSPPHQSALILGGTCGKLRKALGPRLQQIDLEYVIPEEEVLNLCILFFPDHPSFHLFNSNSPCLQQQDGPEPMTSNGEPFHFLSTAPDVLFCKGSPPMKKVIMTIQPDSPQSASKWRQTFGSAAPRVPTKKRKIFTRRVIKKTAQPSPSPSDSNTNQVIISPKLF